jgi:hypothetical protein
MREEQVDFFDSSGLRSRTSTERCHVQDDNPVATRQLSFKEALLSPCHVEHKDQGV